MDALDEEGDDEDEGVALVAQVHTGLASSLRWTLWTRWTSEHDAAHMNQQVHERVQLDDEDEVYSKRKR